MSAAELARNPVLSEFFVRDLNSEPAVPWALPDGSFDAVLCTASVQYLQRPEWVFSEIQRVLAPQGIAIVAFSNRMFYEKVHGGGVGEERWGGGGGGEKGPASTVPPLGSLVVVYHRTHSPTPLAAAVPCVAGNCGVAR